MTTPITLEQVNEEILTANSKGASLRLTRQYITQQAERVRVLEDAIKKALIATGDDWSIGRVFDLLKAALKAQGV